jgi:MoaA/NifB/PqqE/SkfB family radical SAM enzyme
MNYIKTINWIFTYKCNLKCKHCDIWSNPYKKELNINEIKKIVTSKLIQDSYKYYWDFFDISISGGEPLLIKNLKEIMVEIDKVLPNSIHSINTNWILKKEFIDLLHFWYSKWKKFRKINISMDWIPENHDNQRGVRWSFYKSIETIKTTKKIFPNEIIEIKFTITKNNFRDIFFITKLANSLWVFFSFKPAENMLNYTNQSWIIHNWFTSNEINIIWKQIYENIYIEKQNSYINKQFFYNISNYLRDWLINKNLCTIAEDSITIMPDGKIFSCILMSKIWDINLNSVEEIWIWNKIKAQRKLIKDWKCPWCMLMCWSFKSKNLYGEK